MGVNKNANSKTSIMSSNKWIMQNTQVNSIKIIGRFPWVKPTPFNYLLGKFPI